MRRELSGYEKAFLKKLNLSPGANLEIPNIWKVTEKEHNLRRYILFRLWYYLTWLALAASLLLAGYYKLPIMNLIVLFLLWLVAIILGYDCKKSEHVFSWDSMRTYYAVEKGHFWVIANPGALAMFILLLYLGHVVTAAILLVGCVIGAVNVISRHALVKATLPEAEIGVVVSYLKDGTPCISVKY